MGIISRRFWPYCGPLEIEAADLAQAMSSAGHEVEILTIHWEKNWPRHFQFREMEVVRFARRLGGPWGMFRFLREMGRYIDQARFDGLIVYGLARESWAAVRNFGSQLPVTLRIDELEWKNFAAHRLSSRQRRSLNQLLQICVDSPHTQQALLQHDLWEEKIQVIFPGVHQSSDFEKSSARRSLLRSCLSDTHPILEIEPQMPLVVCGSSLEDEGIDLLLAAWKMVIRQMPRARMWLLGEGASQHRVWQRICDFELANFIIMPGLFDELDDILVAADVYLQASAAPLNSHHFARAMVSSTCVVAVANPFVRSFIEHQSNGLLVAPGDATVLAEALLSCLSDAELRRRLGEAAGKTSVVFRIERLLGRWLAPFSTPAPDLSAAS